MTAMTTAAAPFGKVLTAMVTPFRPDAALDLDAAARLATHLVDAGNDGLVVNGTTGESPTVRDHEAAELVAAVLGAVGDRARVVVGVGTNDTAHTVALARQAAREGAHGLLVVTPYYSKPPQQGIVAHMRAVADAAGVSVMVYDIPGRTGVKLSYDTLIALAEHPAIVAVKDASGDLFAGTEVMAATDLAFYCGDDALNLAWLACGAVGVVSVVGHVAAAQYAQLVKAVECGDLASAREVHASLLPAVRAIMTRTQGAIMAKAALQLLGVLDHRTTRPPLVDASDDQVTALRDDLVASGLLPGSPR